MSSLHSRELGSPAQTPRAQREGGAVLQRIPEAGEKDGKKARIQDSHSTAFTPEILLWRLEKEKKENKNPPKNHFLGYVVV